jgi:crossover junction endodeoxyribonuclease RuvC
MRVIGLDPGLRRTGWGIVEVADNRLRHIANGVVAPRVDGDIAVRLMHLYEGIAAVLSEFQPGEAAIEETLANRNATSTLKLGMARGTALLAAARAGLPAVEYLPTRVKKAVVGTGNAKKEQVAMMVGHLLPGCAIAGPDSADALAVAICHAHSRQTTRRWESGELRPATVGPGR